MGKRGILVIAHGSSKPEWVQLVDEAVSRVEVDLPVATGFLEMVEGRTILDGIRALETAGVTEIIAVPLFVSSGSTHIVEIGYYLGLVSEPQIETEGERLPIKAQVRMTDAMDDHPLIAEILLERARELSEQPQQEALLLVGHGSELPGFKEKWENSMNSLARQLQEKMGFRKTACATLHPDSVREKAEALRRTFSRVIVLPLFLSEGYFTRKVVPGRLQGLDVQYSGKTYLPHPLISRWIASVVKEQKAAAENPTIPSV
ncbi:MULTISPECIES: sirohydrochlorin chelatase [Thermoactinomyces]|uniref:Cobalamin biosynthesis protein CbiX n=1 Tax=Thermoactinomyces daqus TaxID=1329516 RepID=A0A7W2AH36_9BACL|nr:CbiX/SirB N-terminal domain-containing protein [Thermoactinomyces daqus]MBA4542832.1 cobalamin biosynthesis protein CbiX [Thermoactinomyces daqus]MBH8598495.1 cobalamin biosynthesis protein CbiX [Thermoactinomyces sp. CICC 10523]MBH8604660.1 cobalamin biosynthesis protein CbiX [Thermoactinomyces sp. CICC 10522]